MNQQAGKICVICGVDCAGQPRIKNTKGQYAHRACAEGQQRAVAAAPAKMTAFDDDEDLMGAFLDDLPGTAEPAATATAGLKQACPGCRTALDPDTVICTGCGFNLITGKGLKTKVRKAKDTGRGQSILETSAVAAGTTYLIGACLGAGLGAVIGGAVWAGIISAVQFQASIVAIGVAVLCGVGAAYGSKGNVSVVTGAIATVCALGAILGGKWYGGAAVADNAMEKVVREFNREWESLDHEGRALYAQRDWARNLIVERLERGNMGEIDAYQFEWALASEDYPDRYPAAIVEETDSWWYGMDEEAQDAYCEDLPELLVSQFESRRQEIREMGFLATIGLRDAIYFVIAVVVAFGLGSNENTAPFVS